MILMTIFMGVELMLSVTIADFCYKGPNVAILSLADEAGLSSDNKKLIEYYIGCEGNNTLATELDGASGELDTMNSTLNLFNCDLEVVRTSLGDCSAFVEEFRGLLSCQTIQPLYAKVV